MDEKNSLAATFEAQRPQLRAMAYRMLGSLAEAEDAVQEAWLKLAASEISGLDNPPAWLTTVVARVCLDMLRARKARREEPLEKGEVSPRAPDPIRSRKPCWPRRLVWR
ncbi:MAG TPA: sigma factor [Rhizomicrobium sp.]|jgi:RNA polymerase sigma-70 factor (ECF subfamily)|nr:sigma factor [Rhizomicrobium sp.]